MGSRFLSHGAPKRRPLKGRRPALSVPVSHRTIASMYGQVDSRPGYSVDSRSTTEECCLIETGGGNRPCEARQPAARWPQGAKSGRAICEIRERREDAPLPRPGCFFVSQFSPSVDDVAIGDRDRSGSGHDGRPRTDGRGATRSSVARSNPAIELGCGSSAGAASHAPTLDAPRLSMEIGALDLELGGRLEAVTVAYRTWGRLNAAGDNAVLVLHALTGDSLAAGPGGWWEPLIGPGERSIPTARSSSAPTSLAAARAQPGPPPTIHSPGAPTACVSRSLPSATSSTRSGRSWNDSACASSSPSVARSVASRHWSGRPGIRSSCPASFRLPPPARSTRRAWR